jgi:hypothetical protein
MAKSQGKAHSIKASASSSRRHVKSSAASVRKGSTQKGHTKASDGYPEPASDAETKAFLAEIKRAKVTITDHVDDDYNTWLG